MTDEITLKWGTLKSWDIKTPENLKLLQEYFDLGASLGAASQKRHFSTKTNHL